MPRKSKGARLRLQPARLKDGRVVNRAFGSFETETPNAALDAARTSVMKLKSI